MKRTPRFTWYKWGVGAERWHDDTREFTASLFRTARKGFNRMEIEKVDARMYRITCNGVMALVTT
jgi:hypothetical protein